MSLSNESNSVLKKVRLMNPDGPTKATGIFKGEASGFLNWNDIPYTKFYRVFKQLLANFWIPDDVSMENDKKDWETLDEDIKDAYLDISVMLDGLDSVQALAVSDFKNFLIDVASKHILINIDQQETIHTQCYTYMQASLIPVEEQNMRFNRVKKDPILLARNEPIIASYEKFQKNPTPQNLFEALINSTNLEGIFFYVGFAFFYALARKNLMMGSSTMISYIHRDEMVHFDFIAVLIRILLTEYPELNTDENMQYIYDTVDKAVELEKKWAEHVLEDIADKLDIDMDEFNEYIEYIANKRLGILGLDNLYEARENVMPWIKTFDDESISNTRSDQFEVKPRSYAKAGADNGFDEL